VVCAWEKQRKEEGWEEDEKCGTRKRGEEKRERKREKLFEGDNKWILNFFKNAENCGWLTR